MLTRFPFSDLAGSAARPALVVSRGPIGQDIILAAISSVLRSGLIATDFLLDPSHPEFSQSGLRVASVIRCHKIGTIEVSHLIRRLGTLGSQAQGEVDRILRQVLSL